MNQICIAPDLALGWLNEISRQRALADHETDILEKLVCRGHRSRGAYVRWTPAMDRGLVKANAQRGGIKAFAEKHGLPQWSAYSRLKKIKKREGVKS